jgi:hypothetical protein
MHAYITMTCNQSIILLTNSFFGNYARQINVEQTNDNTGTEPEV